MAQLVGILIIAALFSVAGRLGVHVYRAAKADGLLPLPKIPRAKVIAATGKGLGGKKAAAASAVRRKRAQGRRAGRTVSVIFAEALTTNWLAKKAHQREHPADVLKPERRPLLARLVNLSGDGASGTLAPPAARPAPSPAPVPSRPSPVPPAPVPSSDGRHLTAVPDPASPAPGGPPMTTTTTASGTSAAGDFFSALNRVLTGAQAGSIRDKIRAHLTLGEGFAQQAAALEQYARWLSETGQYPPAVWEPVMQAAGHLRAGAAQTAESGNTVAMIAKTPAGELAGIAPARDELNRA